MASKQLILRCKTKDGQYTLDTLTGDNTVEDLKGHLFSITGTDPIAIKVLAGFPPKPLDLSNDNKKLEGLPLYSGETLIVEENAKQILQKKNDVVSPLCAEQMNSSAPGILMRRTVPANNSCLFTSVYFSLSNGEYDMTTGLTLRQIIAETVAADSVTYNEAFLGKPNKEYCAWILNENHWGGAIELSILSKYYGVEIVAVDTQNIRLNRFGEDLNYDQRILLIYDGIHYDPLMLETLGSPQQIQTLFQTSDETILQMALEIAREAKSSRQFTDVQNFSLHCLVCNVGLKGQVEAQQHAKETGHTNFGEI